MKLKKIFLPTDLAKIIMQYCGAVTQEEQDNYDAVVTERRNPVQFQPTWGMMD